MIGSLLWQDDRNPGDGIRKRWRDRRLDMKRAIKVSVPIRYGRFSKKDQTYTMVFDNSLPSVKYGKAKAIPFRNDIVNWDQLRAEVEALSAAEGPGKRFIKGEDGWCVCCIVFNKGVLAEKRDDILDRWSQALNENKAGSNYFLQNTSSYSCTTQGELEIPWPPELEGLDFLIATATLPKNRESVVNLTPQEIANHITNREYFIPNFLSGIGTFQDREILSAINSNKRLTQALFKAVVERYEVKKEADSNHRYWSWDHCYKAFHSHLDNDTKALHLANYLASWGMNRGSGGLLQKDYRIHLGTIEILSDNKYTSLDCYDQNDFKENKVDLLFELESKLSNYYRAIKFERMGTQELISPTDTLISKILLGTLSCTPAYDQFFKVGIGLTLNKQFSRNGIRSLFRWAIESGIQGIRSDLPESTRGLPLMKLLDIYFWSVGYQQEINNN